MFGSREGVVQQVVMHLQSRADAIGMRAALDEAHDILREAQRRVGHAGSSNASRVGGACLTPDPVAILPGRD